VSTEDPTTTPAAVPAPADPPPAECYEIRVGARLGSRWAAWFDGLTITDEDDGTTVISGPVADQAALHGLLQKLRDLGINLHSLTRTASGEAIEHPISHTTPARTNPPGANP
jgi:hypothetical protein